MLSILIPIYNQEVSVLVESLVIQSESLDHPVDILCIDDGSAPRFQHANRSLGSLSGVRYEVLPHNIGRARIRNILLQKSKFDHVLFLDGDGVVSSSQFLFTYLACMADTSWTALYGGTRYPTSCPHADYRLHWTYGITREAIDPVARQQDPIVHTHTNNLMLRVSRLGSLRFDVQITGYGYEDIVFAHGIHQQGGTILHIDNPIFHNGLKNNRRFLEDLEASSTTLSILYAREGICTTKVIQLYEDHMKKPWSQTSIKALVRLIPIIRKTLLVIPTNLFLVDLLRYLYFAKESFCQQSYALGNNN